MTITEWAKRWNIRDVAINELLHVGGTSVFLEGNKSEAVNQQQVRMDHCKAGGRLWRNNVGAFVDDRGVPIRYGLANESKAVNQSIKSSDLIGITPQIITPEMVGNQVGIFTAIEMKKGGWQYKGTAREQAQLKFILLVMSMGGIGKFSTGER